MLSNSLKKYILTNNKIDFMYFLIAWFKSRYVSSGFKWEFGDLDEWIISGV